MSRCRRILDIAARALVPALMFVWLSLVASGPAVALEAVVVDADAERIELTPLGEAHEGRGDTLQIVTAPGLDGATDRISVQARTPGTNPNWFVFALRNTTDKTMERWLVAERYNAVGSGVVWPDLDARRIEGLTPSVGFVPDPMKHDRADILHLTLEPGQTITYVAEMATQRFTRIYLWKPVEFEQKARDRQLFNGIMLGIIGLLAVFLTAIFAANHKLIFPVSALVVWCVLAYLCVEFGFWHKLFQMRAENNAQYRAAGEASVAASLVIFLFVFLRIVRWRGIFRLVFGFWIAAQLALVALALVDPRLAATFARASYVAIAGLGALFIAVLAIRGQDRALALVPTWLFLGVWTFAAGMMLTGRLTGDLVVSSLVAGLVLIVVLIGFTVTQFAFRSIDPVHGATPDQQQLRALAVDGAGAAVWEWNSRRDEVKTSANVEVALGLVPGELSCKTEDFIAHVHAADRERLRIALASLAERRGGELEVDFRMRHADNSYRWFEITASGVPTGDARTLRCVGLMRDVTDAKRAQERLLHDAVHDSLTGLPLRELLLDRLTTALKHAAAGAGVRPSIVHIDIDRFKSVNSTFGTNVGDSVLLTVARRLTRHLDPRDTLARIGGDRFAVLVLSESDPVRLAALAEGLRRTVRVPIKIAGQEIVLSGSFGLAIAELAGNGVVAASDAADLVRDAEIAMYRARRDGVDRVEVFTAAMREDPEGRVALEEELRRAIERKQLTVLYQPIVFLPTEELAGFEALVRWEHPRLGIMNPAEFVPLAEQSDLIVRLGSFVLARAAIEVQRWQKELPREDRPVFVAVNVSSRQLIGQELLQELRLLVSKAGLVAGSLKLEITESLVMDNPEHASRTLEIMRDCGVDLALDDFGTGYSSLAYLQRFPFDTIKIDKALVQAAGRDTAGAGATIVRSIVALGHELGKKIVAEGVEEQEDVAFLRSLDCEYAQGYWYGEPMTPADALTLLRQIRKQERRLRRRSFFAPKRKSKGDEAARAAPQAAPKAPVEPAGETPPQAVAPRTAEVPGARAPATAAPPGAPRPRPVADGAAGAQPANGAASPGGPSAASNGRGEGPFPPAFPGSGSAAAGGTAPVPRGEHVSGGAAAPFPSVASPLVGSPSPAPAVGSAPNQVAPPAASMPPPPAPAMGSAPGVPHAHGRIRPRGPGPSWPPSPEAEERSSSIGTHPDRGPSTAPPVAVVPVAAVAPTASGADIDPRADEGATAPARSQPVPPWPVHSGGAPRSMDASLPPGLEPAAAVNHLDASVPNDLQTPEPPTAAEAPRQANYSTPARPPSPGESMPPPAEVVDLATGDVKPPSPSEDGREPTAPPRPAVDSAESVPPPAAGGARERPARIARTPQPARRSSAPVVPPRPLDRPTTLSPQLAATLARIAGLKSGATGDNRAGGNTRPNPGAKAETADANATAAASEAMSQTGETTAKRGGSGRG
jgi:diguanylate cyclase (GGDEF)-like protein/PAS domain S-box-containing protein